MSVGLVLTIVGLTNPACVLLGYLWGRKVRAVTRIESIVVNDENSPPSTAKPAAPTWMRLLAALVALIGIGTVAVGFIALRSDTRQDRIVGCIYGYSNAAAAAQKARIAASNATFEQIDAIMLAVIEAFDTTPAEGSQRVRDAVSAYNEARREAKETQRDNPLPQSPENACADLLD